MQDIQRQFVAALELFEVFTDAEKAELRQSADAIRSVQQGLIEQMKSSGTAETCHLCRGDCCMAMNESEIFTPGYFLALLLSISESERQRIQDVLLKNKRRNSPIGQPLCIFAGEAGCTLPEDMKPTMCISFFCDAFPDADSMHDRFESVLTKETDRFHLGMFLPMMRHR